MLLKYPLNTNFRSQIINITAQVRDAVRQSGVVDGIVTVYCPHTTAGITINEGADPNVVRDILFRLDELFPWEHPSYTHSEGNSAAHLKASMVGTSQAVPVTGGKLTLGTWQAIYFCEFDGPRDRTLLIKVQQG